MRSSNNDYSKLEKLQRAISRGVKRVQEEIDHLGGPSASKLAMAKAEELQSMQSNSEKLSAKIARTRGGDPSIRGGRIEKTGRKKGRHRKTSRRQEKIEQAGSLETSQAGQMMESMDVENDQSEDIVLS